MPSRTGAPRRAPARPHAPAASPVTSHRTPHLTPHVAAHDISLPAPPSRNAGEKLPSLDGLRAVAVGLVLFTHAGIGFLIPGPAGVWFRRAFHGHLGSATFFALSGLLITHRLCGERAKFSDVDLRAFMLRRLLRIYPSLLALVAAVVVAWTLGRVPTMTWHDVAVATLGLWNYVPTTSGWMLGHLWSIGFEQDFYWTWPPVLAFLLARRTRDDAVRWTLTAIAGAPLLRVGTVLFMPSVKLQIGTMLHTRLDAPMFGALAALLMRDERWPRWYARARGWLPGLAAAALLMVVNPIGRERFFGRYEYTIGYTLEGAALVWLMVWVMMEPGTWAGRALNSRVAVALGRRSYAIFLFQQPFTSEFRIVPGPWWLRTIELAAVVELVHRVLERPASRVAARFGRLAAPEAAADAPAREVEVTQSAA